MKKLFPGLFLLFTLLLIFNFTLNTENCTAQWQPDVRLTNDPATSSTCENNAWCVAVNGDNVHTVWWDNRDGNYEIYYKRSTNGGSNWGADIRLTNNSATSEFPSIAVSGSVVHVVWEDTRDNINGEIYYKRSTNAGVNWEADTRITNSSLGSYSSSIAVLGSVVHIVWIDHRDGNPEIYFKSSTDGGLSWGADIRLTNNTNNSYYPSVSVSGTVVQVVWHDNRDGNEEIYYKRSSDGGINWGADTRLTNNSSYSRYPSVSVSDLVVHVVWYDGRDGNEEIYYKRSSDGGINWGADTRLSINTALSRKSSITTSGSYVHVVWQDNRDGNWEIYYKRSTDDGLTWESDLQLTNNSTGSERPSIAVTSLVVHVVWYDDRDGNWEIYYKRNPTGNPAVSAILNSIYRPNDSRTQIYNITLSDSLCFGQIDSVYWYVNDSIVGRQHTMTYPYRQGTTIVKLKIKNNYGSADSTTATVTRCTWKRYTNGQIKAGLSMIGDSILYAISTGDAVYRMDINGNIQYPLTVLGNVLSSCSIGYDTTVFIASDANNLYGFNRYGGQLWAPISLGGQASTTPTADSISNRIYIGVSNGNFLAYNKVSGTYAWSTFLNAPIKSSAVVSYDRKLVVASAAGTIYGFNLNLSNPVPPNWQLSLSDSILVSPCIDSLGYFYFGSRSGKVYKIALTGTNTSTIVWQTPLASAVTSSPTIDANGNIYVGTADGKFYSLNKNGGIRWYFQTPGQIKSTAAITPYQKIYFGNDAGEIYGLDTNKIVKFYYVDSAKISCAMLYDRGTLYFGNEAGRLFALCDSMTVSRGPGIPIWGTFQNNPRRTGVQRGGLISNVNQISEDIPQKFELYQNYPNPFNPVTNIRYQIPGNRFVLLKIYDVLGREVATLVNEKQSPGKYSIDFDGTMFASGVYFYKIQAGKFEQVRKMVILK